MKKIISLCLVAILSLSFTLRDQTPPPENMPVDRCGISGAKITFGVGSSALSELGTSKVCEVWASDSFDNHYQVKVGEYIADYGFSVGIYSIPIFLPLMESTKDVYLTVTFRRVKDYHISASSSCFMYHHPDPIIYSGWNDSADYGSAAWYREPEGSTKNIWDRYVVLKATWSEWLDPNKYMDTYGKRGVPVFTIY